MLKLLVLLDVLGDNVCIRHGLRKFEDLLPFFWVLFDHGLILTKQNVAKADPCLFLLLLFLCRSVYSNQLRDCSLKLYDHLRQFRLGSDLLSALVCFSVEDLARQVGSFTLHLTLSLTLRHHEQIYITGQLLQPFSFILLLVDGHRFWRFFLFFGFGGSGCRQNMLLDL